MKLWKKIACMALCTTMSLSTFAACGESGGGKETEAQRLEKAQASAKKYVDTVSDTLESVKSFSVSGKVIIKTAEEYNGVVEEEEQSFLYLDVLLTQDGDNDFAMQMTAKSEEVEIEAGSIYYSYQMISEAIVKDGYAYTREYMITSEMSSAEIEQSKGLWYKEPIEFSLDADLVNSLLNTTEIKEFSAEILEGAREVLVEKFFNGDAANGKVSWTKNLAPDINEVVAFIESIDETKDTLGDVLNRVLAEITDNLTIEDILAKAKEYKDKTVAEVMTEIDAELAKQGTSLQGIYDKIVNSEVVNLLLTQYGMDAESVAEIKAFKVEELKTTYGEMTLGEVVNLLMEAYYGEEEPVDYASQFITMLESALDTTLEELGMMLPDLSAFQLNDLTIETGLQLNSAGSALEKLYLSVDMDMKMDEVYYEYDEVTGETIESSESYHYVVSADLEIYSFSSATVVINAPAADQVETDY